MAACDRYTIDLPKRQGYFLGQIAVESAGFQATIESINYSTAALIARDKRGKRVLFGEHRITDAQAEQFGRNKQHPADQRALANILYGGKWGLENLGNTEPDDGWRLRGHGLKQLTGRDNIGAFSCAYYGDERLLINPSPLVTDPVVAAASAAWFWHVNGCNKFADKDDIRGLTERVNGGYNGLPERKAKTRQALNLLGVA